MAALYSIRWLPNGPAEDFFGSDREYYVVGPSETVVLKTVPIWCHHCGDLGLGEDVPALDRIDQDIRDLHDPGSELYGLTTEYDPDGAARWLAKLERRQRWREGRKAPPKCIECGSANIVVLPFDEPVRIPPGTLVLQAAGFYRLSDEEEDRFFTPEGDRIRPATRRDWRRTVLGPWRWLRCKAVPGGPAAS